MIVHWAEDAKEFNETVLDILHKHKVKKLVKSKSMLTEECELNPFLEANGINVVETDLGERILQLLNEKPSHIVVPAIHVTREEVGELFERKRLAITTLPTLHSALDTVCETISWMLMQE